MAVTSLWKTSERGDFEHQEKRLSEGWSNSRGINHLCWGYGSCQKDEEMGRHSHVAFSPWVRHYGLRSLCVDQEFFCAHSAKTLVRNIAQRAESVQAQACRSLMAPVAALWEYLMEHVSSQVQKLRQVEWVH